MKGMNASTGRASGGLQHLYQSIAKILTTPVGTRVKRREFGSELPELVDALTGLLAPELTGKLASLDELRAMASTGYAFALVDGAGNVYGAFVIEGVDETQSLHTKEGAPRRVEFTINLTRVDDGLVRSKTDQPKDTEAE